MANPAASFTGGNLFSSGLVFAVNQEKYDGSYILTSLKFARQLFQYTTEVSAINLKMKEGTDIDAFKRKLENTWANVFVCSTVTNSRPTRSAS